MTKPCRINQKNKRRLRPVLSERQNHRCCYCGQRFSDDEASPAYATLEHVQPRSQGGRNVEQNLVMACRWCNGRRASGDARQFARLMSTVGHS